MSSPVVWWCGDQLMAGWTLHLWGSSSREGGRPSVAVTVQSAQGWMGRSPGGGGPPEEIPHLASPEVRRGSWKQLWALEEEETHQGAVSPSPCPLSSVKLPLTALLSESPSPFLCKMRGWDLGRHPSVSQTWGISHFPVRCWALGLQGCPPER